MKALRIFWLFAIGSSLFACFGPGLGERGPRPYRTTVDLPEPVEAIGQGTEIVVCGLRYDIGTPVVLWTDPGGYDANSTRLHFAASTPGGTAPADGELRYQPGRVDRDTKIPLVRPSDSLDRLAGVVDQFVIHYDVCGTSRRCFKVLHDMRGLSVQFMLDLDGTIYQTLDLVHQAWHASQANTRSIGIEIANIGAYPAGDSATLDQWYVETARGAQVRIPLSRAGGGQRNATASLQPRYPRRVHGRIHERDLVMYDLTTQQYAALAKLSAKLCQLFPRIRPEVPRAADGRVLMGKMTPEAWRDFSGILGHFHLTTRKVDPGPAFAWEPYLQEVRQIMRGPR
ncbi:MAG: N-acetylmuramoyl-L-alanine amidase [Planctomycetota bacterium]|jgi:N-acetylmuramoyl-L-alanine amidase